MRYRAWQTEIGNYGLFFALLPHLKTLNIRILKIWKNLLEISFYICVPKTTVIWGMVPEIRSETKNFLLFWASFYPLTPPTTQKIKVLKKRKKHLAMSSFYTCAPKITIIWCMFLEIWSIRHNFLTFWPFFALLDY